MRKLVFFWCRRGPSERRPSSLEVQSRVIGIITYTLFAALPAVTAVVQAQQTVAPDFSNIDHVMSDALNAHLLPGAVIVIGHNGKVVFHKAYGERSLEPIRAPMTEDTVFDMASMTKVLATATAAMKLYQEGRFRLDDPVAKYLPKFAANRKQDITIRQLLTHYSGIPDATLMQSDWSGKEKGFDLAFAVVPEGPPGQVFCYSDINFIVIGALVEKFSGMSLDTYATRYIFAPLGMEHTRFLPPRSWRSKIAPTTYDERHHMLLGVVEDPKAERMGGVAGHAGLFSTANDVAKYAQSLLDRLQGKPSKFPLGQAALKTMTTPQQPITGTALRGLGWDINSPLSRNRGRVFPVGGFGHTGYTGTDLWIDPGSESYVIFLSNRVHPYDRVSTVCLEGEIADAAAEALNIQPLPTRPGARETLQSPACR